MNQRAGTSDVKADMKLKCWVTRMWGEFTEFCDDIKAYLGRNFRFFVERDNEWDKQ